MKPTSASQSWLPSRLRYEAVRNKVRAKPTAQRELVLRQGSVTPAPSFPRPWIVGDELFQNLKKPDVSVHIARALGQSAQGLLPAYLCDSHK